jgi:hypothetical protein
MALSDEALQHKTVIKKQLEILAGSSKKTPMLIMHPSRIRRSSVWDRADCVCWNLLFGCLYLLSYFIVMVFFFGWLSWKSKTLFLSWLFSILNLALSAVSDASISNGITYYEMMLSLIFHGFLLSLGRTHEYLNVFMLLA